MPGSCPSAWLPTPANPSEWGVATTGLILRYQRVALLSHDPLGRAVQPCNFERQMEYLAANCHVTSLPELRQHLESATPLRCHTVAVTFDGPYSDILYTAKAVLERFEIPATVFVPSAHLVETTRYWWDILEDLLVAGPGRRRLMIDVDGRPRRWPLASQRQRFQAFDDLYSILSRKPPAEQNGVTEEIVRDIPDAPEEPDSHALLTAQELQALEDGGLITIGGYPHHGAPLSGLSETEQLGEIVGNKQVLEEVLGHPVEYFADPAATDGDGTGATTRMLKALGYTLSCCGASDTVSVLAETNPYGLPRVSIRDAKPFAFHKHLAGFFG